MLLLLEEGLATAMSSVFTFVIESCLNTTSAELATESITIVFRLLLPPLLNNTEHDMTSVRGAVIANLTQGRVVEDTVDDTIESSGDINVLVVPALDNLGNNPFEDSASDLASRLVEDV